MYMPHCIRLFVLTCLWLAVPAAALAQDSEPDSEHLEQDGLDEPERDELLITGQRLTTDAASELRPELILNRAEISAYGATSIEDLLEDLGPQLESSGGRGGRPIILVDGVRVGSFREIGGYPPEAIQSIEILPEAVALSYGLPADRKVMNIILRPRFKAITGEARASITGQGDGQQYRLNANRLQIRDKKRLAIGAQWRDQSPVLESDRDITGNNAPFRSLIADNQSLALDASYFRPLSDKTSFTATAAADFAESERLRGRNNRTSPPTTIVRTAPSTTLELSGTVNTRAGGWTHQLRVSQTWEQRDSTIDRGEFIDTADATEMRSDLGWTANGTPFEAPAGETAVNLSASLSYLSLDAESVRDGLMFDSELDRTTARVTGSVDYPLLTPDSPVGRVSLNLNGALSQVSDLDTASTRGVGLFWNPTGRLRLQASVSEEDIIPTASESGDPVVSQPDSRVYDFAAGETVDVTRITGGNPDLETATRRERKLSANFRPVNGKDIRVQLDYLSADTDNPIETLRVVTPELQAVLPDRFVRDADGTLLVFDDRPVNFDSSRRETLRWGINYSIPIRNEATDGAGGNRGAGRGEESRAGRGGSRGGRGRGPRNGRWQVSVYHDVIFEDTLTLRDGGPTLDFLGGAGKDRGEPPARHEIQAQALYFNKGLRLRASLDWISDSEVSSADNQGTIRTVSFDDLATVNLQASVDFGQRRWFRQNHPWLNRTRLTVQVRNVFDDKREVTASDGLTPSNYLSDVLDPRGRVFEIRLRNMWQ